MLDVSSSQRNLYAITQGVQSLNVGAVGSFMNVISEGFLFLTLAFGLLIYDSILAIGTISLFGLGAVILYFTLHKRARQIGIEYSDLIVEANDIFIESRGAFREIFVRNQLKIYWEKFRGKKEDLALNVAEAAFMPLVSKYALEVSLILGALLVAALQFSRGDAEQAAASLGVFFATSSRLAPSVLRMQQSLISMKIALYESAATFDFIIQLNSSKQSKLFEERESSSGTDQSGEAFQGSVSVNSVTAYYDNSKVPALKNVSFSVKKGSFTAIVGPSGAGKSTLADCILGIITPNEGSVTLSGILSIQAIRKWPGKIAYVPQESYLANRTIRENVTFNLDYTERLKDEVKTALSESNSLEFVNQLPEDINTNIGERGSQLSGGQRQRIGIARALYPKPELLVLDEATSALDSVSESLITETFTKSKGKCTLIVIAHRLSTVRLADQLIYIESGEVKGIGTFEDLYSKNPKFAAQVEAMNTQ
jgi:ABC-type multidrug transport system fused ATPase/permease subunit